MANQLTITFTEASPAPSAGYLVRYWETSTPGTVLTTTVTSSPAVITGLTGYNYTGTIESVCSFGNSTRVSFTDAVCNVTFNVSSKIILLSLEVDNKYSIFFDKIEPLIERTISLEGDDTK